MKKAKRTVPAQAGKKAPALAGYAPVLAEIKERVRTVQLRAALAANAELIGLYWQIGHALIQAQRRQGWGQAVLPRLALDLRREFPQMKGFSERNLGYMIRFAREYGPAPILQQAAAKLPARGKRGGRAAILQQPAAKLAPAENPDGSLILDTDKSAEIMLRVAARLPWFHHVVLMERVRDRGERLWYMQHAIEHGWSRSVLAAQVAAKAHRGAGRAITNFAATLPPVQSDLAQETLRDPYIFDFLASGLALRERELEQQLVGHIQKFLVALGVGFAFVGRQVHLEVGGQDYYLDLLFYHLKLRCFVVIDLKVEAFKPEFAGKMNFYLSAVDAQVRHKDDQPTIGLLLCQENNRITVEYALRDVKKPIGVAQWQTRLVDSLPKALRGALPSVEQLERELAHE